MKSRGLWRYSSAGVFLQESFPFFSISLCSSSFPRFGFSFVLVSLVLGVKLVGNLGRGCKYYFASRTCEYETRVDFWFELLGCVHVDMKNGEQKSKRERRWGRKFKGREEGAEGVRKR